MTVKPIPEGFHTATPVLTIQGAGRLIEFLTRAFGAVETDRYSAADGSILHAEVRIGDSTIMLSDADELTARPGAVYLYVEDVDAAYERALAAGATSVSEPSDEFYGSRVARVEDPCGNRWAIATHKEDVSYEELHRRFENLMKGAGGE